MATIKAIEARSVHQIQSGQVIVDLCSVVKELVENSLDAGATSIDVRFKSQGLDAIEVQDNGSGVPREDYDGLALKHYTSKLSTYNDLSSLSTFGFRGEALSSLCALSNLVVTTARDDEAPKGTKLEFETSGKLKTASVTACPKGTTVLVEVLFQKLPVRRRELEKNIKREYNKVIGILNAYACICTNTKFSVSNQAAKGKKTVVFSTKGNPTTKENIANVYGAKTIPALIPLKLTLEMRSTAPTPALLEAHGERALRSGKVEVHGHISRPVHGEGRQTPDRQMFFVNSRPCGLPQIAKAFNETYKSYNVTQSPFVFADFKMDTGAYDVNVSPDKRTIMLHDQQQLLNTLRDSLVDLFEGQEQSVPLTQTPGTRMPGFRPASHVAQASSASNTSRQIGDFVNRESPSEGREPTQPTGPLTEEPQVKEEETAQDLTEKTAGAQQADLQITPDPRAKIVQDFNARIASQQSKSTRNASDHPGSPQLEQADEREENGPASPALSEPASISVPSPVAQQPFKVAHVVSRSDAGIAAAEDTVRGESIDGPRKKRRLSPQAGGSEKDQAAPPSRFAQRLRGFAAPGTRVTEPQSPEALDEIQSDDDVEDQPGPYTQVAEGTRDDPDWQKLAQEASSPVASDDDEEPDGIEDDPGVLNAADDDEEYVDEAERRAREEARVRKLVEDAEQTAAAPTQANLKRAANVLKRSGDQTVNLIKMETTSAAEILSKAQQLRSVEGTQQKRQRAADQEEEAMPSGVSPEERLSLTISKSDFGRMRVIGQFNLGFILTVRASDEPSNDSGSTTDDLFIIDQHASDEIYNFHRLSATTELTPQPLVRPHALELTAVEEETVMAHAAHSLLKNGFRIQVDQSGAAPVGHRCKLLTLPTSKETVFDTRDLEELLVLLQDAPAPDTSTAAPPRPVVRPGKVRRMLAMRACRSSIMVGRALTRRGMGAVVRHMGEMSRPWNCPHGRPTMRHVCGLGGWRGWREWAPDSWAHQAADEFAVDGEEEGWANGGETDWAGFVERMQA